MIEMEFKTQVSAYGGFPKGSADKESACNAGDTEGVGWGDPLNGYLFQYSCLEKSMDREACPSPWGKVSDTAE